MLVIRLSGGLGNQMFQYAFGRKLSLHMNQELILNISSYNNYKLYRYGLDSYNVKFEKSKTQLLYNNMCFRKALKILASMGLQKFHKYYIEKKLFFFDRNALETKATHYLGSWQSYKYFEDINGVIINDFTLDFHTIRSCREAVNEIENSESISIHIRRGDYFSNPRSRKDHGILGLEYYKKAFRFLSSQIKKPTVFIFSDDIEWVKDHLFLDYPIRYINGSFRDPAVSMYLMSKCKYNIISNSSFSWWAAWLNQNPNKIIVAPKKWFRNEYTSLDLVPKDWNLL